MGRGSFIIYRCTYPALGLTVVLSVILLSCFFALAQPLQSQYSQTQIQGSAIAGPLDYVSDDYYRVTGGPDLQVALDQSRVYQGAVTSLFLSVQNNGRVTSFKVDQEPSANRPEELLAAQRELQLENQRSVAQGVSIRLRAANLSAFNIRREVAYAGALQSGQVSPRLEFPIEIYENTKPGNYQFYAVANYTYQQDVSVVPYSDRPQNPDIYYLYASAGEVLPLTVSVDRESDVDIKALNATPSKLDIGSKNNILTVFIENQGSDTAKDLVARLRPEAGIYVDMDESPIPILRPGEAARLIYKVDVSKDAVGSKPYQFTLLFDYSDSYRKNLQDSDNVYVDIEPSLTARYWWAAAIGAAIIALAAIFIIRRRRSAAGR